MKFSRKFLAVLGLVKDKEATNVVRYQLSEDGKTFMAMESFRGPRLKYDNVWVFDREE